MDTEEERESIQDTSHAAKWLENEDRRCFEDRLSRLEWLVSKSPAAESWVFPGGLHAKSLFEETRYCFVYAQFLATILLGLAYIELTLAALFYGAGRNDLKRAGFAVLLKEARTYGLINCVEFQDLERIRNKRNAYAHFRKPGHKERVEYRAIHEHAVPYSVIEGDATDVIAAALNIVAKSTV